MKQENKSFRAILLFLICVAAGGVASAQNVQADESEFGPIVRAYLGYLKNEQEVVDDRASRHEVKRAYYIRNSNRIRALRQIAVQIARETGNDYLPELEAAAAAEFRNLLEHPPNPSNLRIGDVYSNTFRFLGPVRVGETFYIFARLDPYEQAELLEKETIKPGQPSPPSAPAPVAGEATSRPRRVATP